MAKRRRWRWRLVGGFAVAAGLWLLLEMPGAPQRGDASAEQPKAGSPAASATDGAERDPDGVPVVGKGEVGEERDVDDARADELGGHVHQSETALRAGRLGAAFAAMEAAARLRLDGEPKLSERLGAAQRAVRTALGEQIDRLATRVREGRILEAREQLRALRDPPHPDVEAALRKAASEREWPGLAADASLPEAPDVEAESVLTPQRSVRFRHAGEWQQGRVVGESDGKVDIELRTGPGVVFPSVARGAVEPVQATVDEAVAEIARAWRAGDRVSAVLWLAYARGIGGDDPRVVALDRALRTGE